MAVPETPELRFKVADEDWEFQEIHRLNYRTFVEEIPQHRPNAERALVDAFHDENTYLIAVRGRRLLGMLAVRGRRPFSLDRKLPDLDRHLPPGRSLCEVRLLATVADGRNGAVFRGLAGLFASYARNQHYDLALISGTLRQVKLYQHLGFVPFGPLVGTDDAPYQPMYLTLERFRQNGRAVRALRADFLKRDGEPTAFLPGPVALRAEVRAAFQRPAISHRSAEFAADFRDTRQELCRLTSARHVQILMGSGTLANDVIAAEISLWQAPGLILSNGEFGERLIDHTTRFGLRFEALRLPWGQPFRRPTLQAQIDADPAPRWVWAVHGETSTGVLNDLQMLKSVAAARDLRLCLDAVSSLGAAPVDLRGVALASGVSGKGLAAPAGLALVFHEAPPRPACTKLPRYLDLGFYGEHDGLPFTLSSNLLHALQAALKTRDAEQHSASIAGLSTRLRQGLKELGLPPLALTSVFPAVTTFTLPTRHNSLRIGRHLEERGILLHYRSGYLLTRNWMQVCLMGEHTSQQVDELLAALAEVIAPAPPWCGMDVSPEAPSASPVVPV